MSTILFVGTPLANVVTATKAFDMDLAVRVAFVLIEFLYFASAVLVYHLVRYRC